MDQHPIPEKIDKRTKQYKQDTKNEGVITGTLRNFTEETPLEKVNTLIENGIQLSKVVFHDTILSFGQSKAGEPENALYHFGFKASRTAEMWLTPTVIVIKQKEHYKLIPLAAVKDCDVLL